MLFKVQETVFEFVPLFLVICFILSVGSCTLKDIREAKAPKCVYIEEEVTP